MTAAQKGRYSKYIRPISAILDLLVIDFLCLYFFKELQLNALYYVLYQNFGWFLIAYLIKFYEVYRFTTPVEIISKLVKQGVLFLLIVIAFFPFSKQSIFSGKAIASFLILSFVFITISKVLLFYYLKKYRIVTGSNFRNAVIIGYTPEAIRLKGLFETRNDYGYRFLGYFSDKKSNADIKGKLADLKTFVIENEVHEIYCSLNEVSDAQLKNLVDFADENDKIIKFIPDTKEIFSKNLKTDYYDIFPVLTIQKSILDDPTTKVLKRTFDIVFSFIVTVGFFPWLFPLLAILIKLESKGPVFFKQGRPGLDEKEFFCYKFRSMQINKTTEIEASKNDPRVTKMGRFMRKTSLDEMPQFLNVLLGDMSVVGPRPHLWSQNKAYGNTVKKYMVRHYVKPGITGWAQVNGYRGETKTNEDIIKRVNHDIWYIENWAFLLDLKIIWLTIYNMLRGEENAC